MKSATDGAGTWPRVAAGLILLALLAGCATQIDWASRVGKYTLDQAVVEFGPPDKQAKLADSTVVAEWLIRRGYYSTYAYYPFPGYYYYGPVWPTYFNSYTPDLFLRLTFGPNGELVAWKKFYR